MTIISISEIVINRSERQRRKLSNIPELAASIAEIGMINPIVLNEDNTLMAGERRLEAAKSLGWDSVPITVFNDLTTAQQQLLELEENVKREDLGWKDHCKAVARYHELKHAENNEWTQVQSAKALGISKSNMHYRIAVYNALEEGHELVTNADKYSVAQGIVERKRQREGVQDIKTAADIISTAISPVTEANNNGVRAKAEGEQGKLGNLASSFGFTLLHESFNTWIDETEESDFNFIHCDFPYGIDADKHALGASDKFGGYSDTKEIYWELLDILDKAMQQGIIADSAHCMFWFSMDYYTETKKRLEDMGWTVNPFPLYWFKSDNSGILPDPKRGPRRNTETAFLCSLGDRYIVQAVSNTFPYPNKKHIHMSEKPQEMLAHFFRMFVDDNTKMLDPTMGSANAVRVAYEKGAGECFGLEIDEQFFLNACHAHDDIMGG